MASNQQPIKIEVKAEPKATPEYKVIVPEQALFLVVLKYP
jgi:hypothetical protein